MQYISKYSSPLGNILLAADDTGIIGIWFENQKYYGSTLVPGYEEKELPIFSETKEWLDTYFSGKEPSLEIPIHFIGTDFQKEVWNILRTIPYGTTITYNDIARKIAEKRNLKKMSAQAVGNAVGRNPISIIVPCHRVLGAGGKITGYAGGIEKKLELLKLEYR